MPRLPEDFTTQMKTILGDDYSTFVDSLETESPVSIRINPVRDSEAIQLPLGEKVPWASDAFYLTERPKFIIDPLFHGGAYYVQEASSMFLEQALKQAVDLEEPLAVLDLCASPGGKSTHITSLISEESLLVSNEVIRPRAHVLAENIIKWGRPNNVVSNNDPKAFSSLQGFFDVIVVDAPCSGEGMFRKDVGARDEWSAENVKLCAQRQQRILMDIWPSLKPGGVLIYSTCTYNRQENEENLKWLAEETGAKSISLEIDEAWGVTKRELEGFSGYQFYPHKAKGEGFFIAVLQKGEEGRSYKLPKKVKRLAMSKLSKKDAQFFDKYLNEEGFALFNKNEVIHAVPEQWAKEADVLARELNLLVMGVELGQVMKNKLKPSHQLALSELLNRKAFTEVEVDLDTALNYLRKEDIRLEVTTQNWLLLTYKGFALGWAKKVGNRINNHYPKEWRIRNY